MTIDEIGVFNLYKKCVNVKFLKFDYYITYYGYVTKSLKKFMPKYYGFIKLLTDFIQRG